MVGSADNGIIGYATQAAQVTYFSSRMAHYGMPELHVSIANSLIKNIHWYNLVKLVLLNCHWVCGSAGSWEVRRWRCTFLCVSNDRHGLQ